MTIKLHMFPTMNALKVIIALEEMGLDYEVIPVDILNGGQDAPEFRALNPNGRIPALVEGDVVVFESAAILQYLGRKTGLFYPSDEVTRTQIDSWLHWQMSGLGPASGNLNWFRRATAKPGRDPVETSLATHRFEKECARLFDVLEDRLTGRGWLCDDYSIADMCCWPWVNKYPENGGGLSSRPSLSQWHKRISDRSSVRGALSIGLQIGSYGSVSSPR